MTKHDAERADRIVDVILLWSEEFGHPPSVRNIMQNVGLASSSSVFYHLRALVRDGRLRECSCGCGRYLAVPA